MDMPQKIWVTKEDHYWPTFRNFHASDLDHGPEYPQYVRLDVVHGLTDQLILLKDSISGQCYLGQEAELSIIEEIINKTKEMLNEG